MKGFLAYKLYRKDKTCDPIIWVDMENFQAYIPSVTNKANA